MPEGICPRLVPEGRADLQLNWPTPSTRARVDPKSMPVDRANAAPIARPLCRSHVHPEYWVNAARQASSALVNRQPGAEWGTVRQYAGVLSGSRRVTNADCPAGRDECSCGRATWAAEALVTCHGVPCRQTLPSIGAPGWSLHADPCISGRRPPDDCLEWRWPSFLTLCKPGLRQLVCACDAARGPGPAIHPN